MRHNNLKRSFSFLVAFVLVQLIVLPNASKAQEPIKIGVVSGYTGTYAAQGQHQKWMVDMAVEEINAKGGLLGRKLQAIHEDDQNSPAISSAKAEKLILQDKVNFLIGPISSPCTLNDMKIAEKYKKVMMVSISMSDKITGAECSRYTFRVCDNPILEANALIGWLLKNMGKRIYLLSVDNAYGKSSAQEYGKAIDRLGGKVVGESFFPLNTKDFAPYFGTIKAANPEVLVGCASGNDAISMVTQLREYGFFKLMKIAGVGSLVSADVLPAMGENADGIISVDRYCAEIPTPENKAFVQKFMKAYKEVPSRQAASTYEAVLWLAQAVKQAKSVEADAVIKALEGSTFNGPQGPKTMRAGDHQASMNMHILRCKGGRQIIIDQRKGEEVMHPNFCNKW
jgi:branched-chain amino acid transport system substrate-binding protein